MNALLAMHLTEMMAAKQGIPVSSPTAVPPPSSAPSPRWVERSHRRYSTDSGENSYSERYRTNRRQQRQTDNNRTASRRDFDDRRPDHRTNHDLKFRGGKNSKTNNKSNKGNHQQQRNKWSSGHKHQVKKPIQPRKDNKSGTNKKFKTDRPAVAKSANHKRADRKGTKPNPVVAPVLQVTFFLESTS